MEQLSFELTPQQKGMLATLSRETGKPVPALLDEALEALQAREHAYSGHAREKTNGNEGTPVASPSPPQPKHIWEIAQELFGDLSEEDLARLPVDGAAQHDHYIYGLPKRPV